MDIPTHYVARVEWTEERVAQLIKLNGEGLSRSEIAKRLDCGVTRNAVIGKLLRLGVICKSGMKAGRPRAAGKEPRTTPSKAQAKSGPSLPSLKASAAKSVMPVLAEPAPRDDDGRITLLKLTSETCRWPVGDPLAADFCFCGHAPRENSSYCEFHARVAYVPMQQRANSGLSK